MSYCRWSSMGYRCDAYCYESGRGFEIHLATHRRPEGCPQWDLDSFTATSMLEERAWLDDAANSQSPIGLPYDGMSYCFDTAGECANKLRELRAVGYIIPDSAINELDAEAAT